MRTGEMSKSNVPATKGVAGVTSVYTRVGVVTLVPSDVGITAAVDKGVVYMDGTSYANSAAFTWDKATHTLTLGGGVDGTLILGATPFVFKDLGGGVVQLADPGLTFDVGTQILHFQSDNIFLDGTNGIIGANQSGTWNGITLETGTVRGTAGVGLQINSNATANSELSLQDAGGWQIGNAITNMAVTAAGDATWTFGAGAAQFGAAGNWNINSPVASITMDAANPALWAQMDNAVDLGGLAATLGADQRWRTGYFGTSVVTPLITSTTGNFSGTVTAAAFVTASLQAAFVASPYGAAAGNTGEMRFLELAASGTDYVALKAPDALAAPLTYTLPAVDHIGPWMSNGSGLLSVASGQDLTIVVPVANKTLTFTKGVLTGVV